MICLSQDEIKQIYDQGLTAKKNRQDKKLRQEQKQV